MAPSRRPAPRKLSSDTSGLPALSSKPHAMVSTSSSSSALGGLMNTSTPSHFFLDSTPHTNSPAPSLDHTTRNLPLGSGLSRPIGVSTDGSSRKVAAMSRASMACVSCREAKHKCDGHPPSQVLGPPNAPSLVRPQQNGDRRLVQPTLYSADQRCTRCDLNDTACLWAPKAKLGRPSKKSVAAASAMLGEAETALERGFRGMDGSVNSRDQPLPAPTIHQSYQSRSSNQLDSFVPPSNDDLSWLTMPQEGYHRPTPHQQTSYQQTAADWMSPGAGASMANQAMSLQTPPQPLRSPLLPLLGHSSAPSSIYRQQQSQLVYSQQHQQEQEQQQQQQRQTGGQGSSPPPASSFPPPPTRGHSMGSWNTFTTVAPHGLPQRSVHPSNLFHATNAQTHQTHLDRGQQPFAVDPLSRSGLSGPGVPHGHHPSLQSGSPSSDSPPGSLSAGSFSGSLSGSLSGSMAGSMSYSAAAHFPNQMRTVAHGPGRTHQSPGQPAPLHLSPAISSAAMAGTATAHAHSDPFTIRTGMQLYFSSSPRYCLAIAPCQQYRLFALLERWAWLIAEQPQAQLPEEARDFLTLAQAIAAVGWKLSRENSSTVLHNLFLRQTRDGLDGIVSRPASAFKSCPVPHLVSCLQALLFGSTLEYSIADVERSGAYLQKAADIIIELNIPVFDLTPPVHGSSRAGERMATYADLNAIHVPELDLADDVRRCFWELCVTQTMYCASTSGDASMCLLRSGIPIDINFPDSPPPSSESDYGLRTRSASLLLESVQSVPPNPSARLNRLEALNGVVTDLAHQAKRRFDNSLTEESAEMTFTAYVMLNAARIQLIKMTFFPTLQDELDHLVLTVGRSDRKLSLTAALPLQVARAAIKTIIQGADNIVELTRADNSPRPAFPNLYGAARLAVTPVLNRSPFHESYLLTASLAYVSAAVLWKDLIDSMSHRQDDGRLASAARAISTSRALVNALDKGPAKGTTVGGDIALPSFPRDTRSEADGNGDVAVVWVHHNVLSNLAFAHVVLVTASHIWPMAGKLAGEVANCRSLIDRRAPLDG